MQYYDINVPTNGSPFSVACAGRFIYYIAGSAGGTDNTLKVRAGNTGSTFLLKPGQSIRLADEDKSIDTWYLSNSAGVAPILGTVLVGDGDFKDNRISGSVDVVDGGKSRTMAKQTFLASPNLGGAAGQLSHVQLWNPAGSGKNLFIEQIIGVSAQTQALNMRVSSAPLSTASPAPISKNINSGATSVGLCFTQLNATEIAGTGLVFSSSVMAGGQTCLALKEPICLPPGAGFFLVGIMANATLGTLIEYFEESI